MWMDFDKAMNQTVDLEREQNDVTKAAYIDAIRNLRFSKLKEIQLVWNERHLPVAAPKQ